MQEKILASPGRETGNGPTIHSMFIENHLAIPQLQGQVNSIAFRGDEYLFIV